MNQKRQHPASFAVLSLLLCGAFVVVFCIAGTIGRRFFAASAHESVSAARPSRNESRLGLRPDRVGTESQPTTKCVPDAQTPTVCTTESKPPMGDQAAPANPQTDSPPPDEVAPAVDVESNANQEDASQNPEPPREPVDEIRRLLIGTWEDDYQGKRTMTLSADGTGTMVVELSGISGAVFGSRLTFQMEWSLEDDRLTKRTIGGDPEGKVKTILAMMGDRAEERIIELTERRLLVEDLGMQQQFDWRRVNPDAQR
jgi:hypothetical protein